jgi:CBS domain-containing protein
VLRTSLSDYLATRPPSHPVVLEPRTTVADALAHLARPNILSAPVVGQLHCPLLSEPPKSLGFFSARSASRPDAPLPSLTSASVALHAFLAGIWPSLKHAPPGGTRTQESFSAELRAAGLEFSECPVAACATAGDGKLVTATKAQEVSLLQLAQSSFVWDEETGVTAHRVAVWEADEDALTIKSIVSQNDVLRYIAHHTADLAAHDSLTVADLALPLAPDAVLTVSQDTVAIEAFALLALHGRSALGVTVAPGGALVGCLAASDLRGLQASDWGRLALPLKEFLPAGGLLRAVGVQTPLRRVLALFEEVRGLHHVFVVDGDGRPTGVLTPSDLLTLLLGEEDA